MKPIILQKWKLAVQVIEKIGDEKTISIKQMALKNIKEKENYFNCKVVVKETGFLYNNLIINEYKNKILISKCQ